MQQSSKTLGSVILGWIVATGLSALVLLGNAGTFWITSHDTRFASVVWPILGTIFISGILLLLSVHLHIRLLGDSLGDS
jgi:hypothetical protein